jgi:hypothetical protein
LLDRQYQKTHPAQEQTPSKHMVVVVVALTMHQEALATGLRVVQVVVALALEPLTERVVLATRQARRRRKVTAVQIAQAEQILAVEVVALVRQVLLKTEEMAPLPLLQVLQ